MKKNEKTKSTNKQRRTENIRLSSVKIVPKIFYYLTHYIHADFA